MKFNNNIPIYIQVIEEIKKDIVSGVLNMGEKLPSGRDLALKYKINPNTANRIYKELEASDICFTKRGLGTYITEDTDKINAIREEMAGNIFDQFFEGVKNLGYSKEEVHKKVDEKYGEQG